MESEQTQLHNIIGKQADGILIVERNGIVRLVNEAAEELLGRTQDELVGSLLGIPLTSGETTVIDIIRDGEEPRVAEMRVVETEWEGETVFLASVREITERARFLTEASAVLAGSLDFHETINSLGSLIVKHLADGCVIHCLDPNHSEYRVIAHRDSDVERRAKETLSEEEQSEVPSMAMAQLFALATSEIFETIPPNFYPSDSPCAQEWRFFQNEGSHSAIVVPMASHGRTIGIVTLFRSSGPHSYRQADLVITEDLAYRAALALENVRLYKEAQDAVHRRDEFLAMLAHELRNPLSPLLQANYLLNQHAIEKPQLGRICEVIQHQCQHMARLLDDLLDMSRVTCGKITLRKQVVDLNRAIESAIRTSEEKINEKKHELSVSLPWNTVLVSVDPARLEQIFVNLLNNAAKYTPDGGRICVEAVREGDDVLIHVRDNGIGITPEKLPHVFDLFMQVDSSLDRAQSGLGIGLTLVRNLVQMHGGEVSAHSDGRGQGSQFTIRLPALGEGNQVAAPRVSHSAPIQSGEQRILLVEDSPENREMLAEVLRMNGYQVECAADGLEAVEKATAPPPARA
ncbi:MAG: ATP-binding protein, partial [Gemmataceae bacterium]